MREAWRRWTSDPPLSGRILWRDGIRPETLISDDRRLMARTFGSLFAFGGLSGLLLLGVGEQTDRNDPAIAILATIAILLGMVCFVGYARLPTSFFHVATVIGTLMITGASASASHGAEGIYALYFVWVVFLAFFFFPFREGALHAVFAAVAYGVVLYLRDIQFGLNLWISAVATLGTTGAIMGLLRARIEQLAADSASEASTDSLTAIANRRGFDQRFALEVARTARGTQPLSLIMCDLDRFKAVNDMLGHEAGDTTLQRAAAVIQASVRTIDFVARLGGEEFAVLLPNAAPADAIDISERVRVGVRDQFADAPVALTASCGVATLDPPHDGDGTDLFRAADTALYRAKRAGRNCSVAYEESAGEPSLPASSTK